jgi:hypothetical protein
MPAQGIKTGRYPPVGPMSTPKPVFPAPPQGVHSGGTLAPDRNPIAPHDQALTEGRLKEAFPAVDHSLQHPFLQ